jgi:hypothetical protein
VVITRNSEKNTGAYRPPILPTAISFHVKLVFHKKN